MARHRLAGRLPPNVVTLGVTSFFTDVSSEMIFSLLPFYMASFLGMPMALVGLVEGAAEAVASLLKGASGWWSDRVQRRKPLVVAGYALSAAVKPLFAAAVTPLTVLAVRVSDRVGKGIRTAPRDALIADSSRRGRRGLAFGLHRAMDTAGAVAGPLLAFLLFPLVGYTGVFALSIMPAALGVGVLVVKVRDVRTRPGPRRQKEKLRGRSVPPRLLAYVAVSGLLAFATFSYAFFLLRAADMGVSVAAAPLLYIAFNLAYSVSAMPLGILADRVGQGRALAAGCLAYAIVSAGFAAGGGLAQALVLFPAYGVGLAAVETSQRAVLPELCPARARGTGYGLLSAVTGACALPASLAAGVLWQVGGGGLTFTVAAAVAMACAGLLALLFRKPAAGCET